MTKWRVYQEKESVFLIQRKGWFFWWSEYQDCFHGREKVYFSNLQSAMEAIDLELKGEVKAVGKVVAQNNGNGWKV